MPWRFYGKWTGGRLATTTLYANSTASPSNTQENKRHFFAMGRFLVCFVIAADTGSERGSPAPARRKTAAELAAARRMGCVIATVQQNIWIYETGLSCDDHHLPKARSEGYWGMCFLINSAKCGMGFPEIHPAARPRTGRASCCCCIYVCMQAHPSIERWI